MAENGEEIVGGNDNGRCVTPPPSPSALVAGAGAGAEQKKPPPPPPSALEKWRKENPNKANEWKEKNPEKFKEWEEKLSASLSTPPPKPPPPSSSTTEAIGIGGGGGGGKYDGVGDKPVFNSKNKIKNDDIVAISSSSSPAGVSDVAARWARVIADCQANHPNHPDLKLISSSSGPAGVADGVADKPMFNDDDDDDDDEKENCMMRRQPKGGLNIESSSAAAEAAKPPPPPPPSALEKWRKENPEAIGIRGGVLLSCRSTDDMHPNAKSKFWMRNLDTTTTTTSETTEVDPGRLVLYSPSEAHRFSRPRRRTTETTEVNPGILLFSPSQPRASRSGSADGVVDDGAGADSKDRQLLDAKPPPTTTTTTQSPTDILENCCRISREIMGECNNSYFPTPKSLMNEKTCLNSVKYGTLDVLQWAVENGCPWNPKECRDLSVRLGHDDITSWIDEKVLSIFSRISKEIEGKYNEWKYNECGKEW